MDYTDALLKQFETNLKNNEEALADHMRVVGDLMLKALRAELEALDKHGSTELWQHWYPGCDEIAEIKWITPMIVSCVEYPIWRISHEADIQASNAARSVQA